MSIVSFVVSRCNRDVLSRKNCKTYLILIISTWLFTVCGGLPRISWDYLPVWTTICVNYGYPYLIALRRKSRTDIKQEGGQWTIFIETKELEDKREMRE